MEIEIKAKVKDLKVIHRRLIRLGAKSKKKVHQIDKYYSLYKRPLTKRKGSIVRVRHNVNEKRTFFEFDWALNDFAAHEIEVEVNNYNNIQTILKKMKAKVEYTIDKKREYFRKGQLEIVLDRVKGLGNFMEIEIQGQDTKLNRRKIYNLFEKLGVDKKDFLLSDRYCSLIQKKKGKKHAYF